MKSYSEVWLGSLLAAILIATYMFISPRVCAFASGLAALWFFISFVLLTRPPGIPEFVSDEVGSDEQHVIRKDVIPKLPWLDRLRLSLGVACGSCLLLWLSLFLLAR